MAKVPNSVIGVDLGRYSLRAVLLQRKGERIAISHYASRPPEEPVSSVEALARELKALFKVMGGSAKYCAVALSSPGALIRIIEQAPTPTMVLRDALRLNGMALLNQDCRGFVLDCDRIMGGEPAPAAQGGQKHRYLVGGVPRPEVEQVAHAFEKNGLSISRFQLAPICAFNAFEFARPDIFNQGAFFLVDIGHTSSTVMAGVKGELVLVRSIDCGGQLLLETLVALSGEARASVLDALENEDELMVENSRMALSTLIREIRSSIGFFEARCEDVVDRVFVSGGPAKSATLLKVLSEEIRLPCESWNALAQCDVSITGNRAAGFRADILDLNVACGAAAEVLKGN